MNLLNIIMNNVVISWIIIFILDLSLDGHSISEFRWYIKQKTIVCSFNLSFDIYYEYMFQLKKKELNYIIILSNDTNKQQPLFRIFDNRKIVTAIYWYIKMYYQIYNFLHVPCKVTLGVHKCTYIRVLHMNIF